MRSETVEFEKSRVCSESDADYIGWAILGVLKLHQRKWRSIRVYGKERSTNTVSTEKKTHRDGLKARRKNYNSVDHEALSKWAVIGPPAYFRFSLLFLVFL